MTFSAPVSPARENVAAPELFEVQCRGLAVLADVGDVTAGSGQPGRPCGTSATLVFGEAMLTMQPDTAK